LDPGIDAVPLSVALVAGALSALNPCGFPFLPAFLSFYVGAEEQALPPAPNRLLQGLAVGLGVTAGFVAVFAVVAVPVQLGASLVADAVPWVGFAAGVVLAAVGLATLAGRHLWLPVRARLAPRRERRAAAVVLFGAGYGLASLGCTLPVFLVLVGASLAADGTAASVAVFCAYVLGMAVILCALSVGAGLLRGGLARNLRRLLPYANRLAGALLAVAGVYVAYYWWRLERGPSATLADDPVVGAVARYTARLETLARGDAAALVAVAAVGVAAAAAVGLWRWRGSRLGRSALLALAVAVFAGCGSGVEESAETGAAPDRLQDVAGIETLAAAFDERPGEPRLILLLAPT
jgi:cytochrome c biogenesis protein CcdA